MSLPPKNSDLIGIINTLEKKVQELEFLVSRQNFDTGTGIPGPTGAQGLTGATGAQGPAASITVGTTTTTASGTSAAVANSGTSGAAILDFSIPRGDKGDVGAIGPREGLQFSKTTGTNDADPGEGKFRPNSTSASTTTFLYINARDINGDGAYSYIDTWDDSTSVHYGYLNLTDDSTTSAVYGRSARFTVTSVTFVSGATIYADYYKVGVSWLSGRSGTWGGDTDKWVMVFTRTGNKGDKGDPGPQGTSGNDLIGARVIFLS